MIASTAIVYPGVTLGKNSVIEDFCIIGAPLGGQQDLLTVIGDHAVIRSHTVIYAGNVIGSHFQTGNKANIRELNIIGNNVSIGTLSVIEHHVHIEDDVRIHSQVFVPEYSILKRGAWLGPQVTLTNAKFPKHPDAKRQLTGVTVGENAKIGANATILPGVSIGGNSLIGAGSVVTKDVTPGEIVKGSPAVGFRQIHY
jgi:acetyltransferase-like isoleucine patch superfamily enzyme